VQGQTLKLPDFLLVGAAKSGTTSLYSYLREHPQIFMPPEKEPHFMVLVDRPIASRPIAKANEFVFEFGTYVRLFEGAGDDQLIGEASTSYLYYHDRAIRNIKRYIPEWKKLKILVILRNPVDRAFSHYWMQHRVYRYESLSFEDAVDYGHPVVKKRMQYDWRPEDYIGYSMYHDALKAYMETFPHTRVYLYEDLAADPKGLVRDLYRFLGVDDSFVPANIGVRYNPRTNFLARLLLRPGLVSSVFPPARLIPLEKRVELVRRISARVAQAFSSRPKMKPETRERLKALFREDILRTQELIGRDLSKWLD
jgi:hypothetical protein